jgi:hypothetical protein
MPEPLVTCLTVSELRARWRCRRGLIVDLLRKGVLQAIRVSNKGVRILPESILACERSVLAVRPRRVRTRTKIDPRVAKLLASIS